MQKKLEQIKQTILEVMSIYWREFALLTGKEAQSAEVDFLSSGLVSFKCVYGKFLIIFCLIFT